MRKLNARQQALVVRHMALVRMHVRHQLGRLSHRVADQEKEDIRQEALLGLMKAASLYAPERCGPFAAYALSHIRGAVCRYLALQCGGLILPEKAARRILSRRKRERQAPGEAEHTDSLLPHFFHMGSSTDVLDHLVYREYAHGQSAEPPVCRADPIRGDALSELPARAARAVSWAAEQLKAARNCRADRAAVVEAIVQERLLVPDCSYRTAMRELARRFGCSMSRLLQCERRLLHLIRQHMACGDVQRASCEELIGRPAGIRSEGARKDDFALLLR